MKRPTLIITITFVSAMVLFSCKKTYECSCHTATGAHEHMDVKAKKADAEAECKAKAVGTYTACSLE